LGRDEKVFKLSFNNGFGRKKKSATILVLAFLPSEDTHLVIHTGCPELHAAALITAY
jgi:hypothetical protein